MFYYLLNKNGIVIGESSCEQSEWLLLKKCPDILKYKYYNKKWVLIDTSVN